MLTHYDYRLENMFFQEDDTSEFCVIDWQLIVRARPILHRLMGLTGETASLVRLLGDAAVAVDQVDTDPPVRLAYAPGRSAARASSSGLPDADGTTSATP